MNVISSFSGGGLGERGVFRGTIGFANPALAGFAWPLFEARGEAEGPRLCVSAGVHVNEVSSIEAAIRLQSLFDPRRMRGTVSIIPLINQPALYRYTEYACPIDGKNINFTFPGRAAGTFSEALCDAIQHDWCAGAACYVDLHGGDLRERVAKFVLFQRTGDAGHLLNARGLAMCFDADLVVGLAESELAKPGRPPTGFAREGRLAVMSEAGANGIIDEESVAFHVEGVLRIARQLGIIEQAPSLYRRQRTVCDDYLWVTAPADGQFYAEVEPAERVRRGQRLGVMRNFFGETVGEIVAPETGIVLWRMTHPTLKQGAPALAIAIEETPRREA
ncbi:succinylglutamate desuccinylase/aspartoacylase domain-containing protein [Dongia sedimenti]|uniref:Succinylglutamate desuccinylase/aspartoacylase family protein n=1 Tax=Dongia sedimenti TaxID=3064282 RepID=A0ABU0YTZ7_9PROT|nr:succinylglutamate desuccinylase/aspartoacylase family protein [Rhodospirillaceae bacterium R-7]